MKSCKKCNSDACKTYQGEKRKEGDVNFLLRARACNIRRCCKARKDGREVAQDLGNILVEQYNKQNGKCYYTGEPMTLANYQRDDSFATVDRVNPLEGYVRGNVVFCKSIINKMKQDMTIERFRNTCRQILSFESFF